VDRRRDFLGQRAFKLGRGGGERLDLDARAFQRRLELGRRDTTGGRFGDPCLGALERRLVHGEEATLRVGWTPPSSTTSCRRS
jgi:hypothetical protein